MEEKIIANYEKPVTKKQVFKVIKEEKARIYNKMANINFEFIVKDYVISLNFTQVKELINNLSTDEKGYLHQNYDDNNDYITINLMYDESKGKKSIIRIYG